MLSRKSRAIPATGYKPFLISNFRTGQQLSLEPWLLPQDAFEELYNGYLFQGVINKRKGYTLFDKFIHRVTDAVLDNTPNGVKTSFSGTISNIPIRDSAGTQITITATLTDDSTETITPNATTTTTLEGTQGATGTINYTTGAWTLDFSTSPFPPKNATNITVTYDYYPGNEIMGIWELLQDDGTEELIVFDTKRINKYNTTNSELDDISAATPANIWSGADSDFFWCCNHNDVLYITNFNDQVYSYNGTSVSAFTVDIDGGGNDMDTCLLIFSHKGRLIFLRTSESGTAYPQRARWSDNVSDWTGDEYLDADTEEFIRGAEFLHDELVVFFDRSVYMLEYIKNSKLPFKWTRIASTEGCYATFSVLAYADELTAIGATGLVGTDGTKSYRIDDKIPDLVLDFEADKIQYCYSATLDEKRQAYLTYPNLGSDYPNRILCLNYDDISWSIYDIAAHCFGFWDESLDPTWESDDTWSEREDAWGDKTLQAGYPVTLFGDRSGNIFKLNFGGSDNGSDIEFRALSGWWNPYVAESKRARLGYLDLFVTTDSNISVNIDFYKNHRSSYYKRRSFTFTGTGEKKWFRVKVGEIGNSHRIKISHTASDQTLQIHAIMPWFKPEGVIKDKAS